MPTRRMIDPAIWQSESMANLTRDQRLLFIGLFSNADDQGRLRGSPHLIRSIVFPFDDISIDQVKSDLQAIAAEGSIIIYEVDDKEYIQIAHWWDYQSPQWAYPSKSPAPQGWFDRLRYRKDNSVITYNWKPNHGDDYGNTPPAHSGPLPSSPNGLPNELPKPLPKDLPNGLGGSIELGLDLEIENKEEVEANAALAQVSTFYQSEIGPVSPVIRDKLLEWCKVYPVEWIKAAIVRAVEQNVRKMSYVKGILENWQAIGGPQNDDPQPAKSDTRHRKTAANSVSFPPPPDPIPPPPEPEYIAIWESAKSQVRDQMTGATFDTLFKDAQPIERENGTFELRVKASALEMIEHRPKVKANILTALQAVKPEIHDVDFKELKL